MKKGKLLLSLAMMCLSIAVLCFGVLAATSVTYSISGTISYEVKDAYVEITTTKYTTATEYEKASDLRTDGGKVEAGTLGLTGGEQMGTTYNSLNNAGTKDNSGLALTYNLSSTTKVRTNWLVAEVKNLSDAEIYVKVIDDHELDFFTTNSFIYRTQDITSLAGKGSTKIVIGFTLWDETTQIDSVTYGLKLEVGVAKDYSPLKYQAAQTIKTVAKNADYTKPAYYYVEMGDFYGLPVRWKLVAEKTTTETSGNGVYKYDNIATPTTYYKNISTATETGLETYKKVDGIFYQETMTAWANYCDGNTWPTRYYTERDDGLGLTDCSFNNYVEGDDGEYYKTTDDENATASTFKANDYYNSKIREYLTSTGNNKVYKYSDGETANQDNDYSNFVTDLNILETNYVYSKIKARTSMEMMTGDVDGAWDTTDGTDFGSGKTTSDKFWLLSMEELMTWVAGKQSNSEYTNDVWGKVVWGYNNEVGTCEDYLGAYAWLRSGSSSASNLAYNVYGNGVWHSDSVSHCDCGARAAFNFALGD